MLSDSEFASAVAALETALDKEATWGLTNIPNDQHGAIPFGSGYSILIRRPSKHDELEVRVWEKVSSLSDIPRGFERALDRYRRRLAGDSGA